MYTMHCKNLSVCWISFEFAFFLHVEIFFFYVILFYSFRILCHTSQDLCYSEVINLFPVFSPSILIV